MIKVELNEFPSCNDWLENDSIDCGIMSPPMEAEKALSFLTDYLIGENWYVVDPISPKQVNTNRVHEILWKYSKKYRKEYKQYRKQKLRERD